MSRQWAAHSQFIGRLSHHAFVTIIRITDSQSPAGTKIARSIALFATQLSRRLATIVFYYSCKGLVGCLAYQDSAIRDLRHEMFFLLGRELVRMKIEQSSTSNWLTLRLITISGIDLLQLRVTIARWPSLNDVRLMRRRRPAINRKKQSFAAPDDLPLLH